MLSKMSCGLSWSRLSAMSTTTSLASPLHTADEVALAAGDQLLEELEVLRHPQRVLLRLFGAADDGGERGLVGLREKQLVVPLARLLRVEQVVVAQLARRESIHRLGLAQRLGQCGDQQRHRGQALLAVDHEQRRLVRHLGQPLFDVDDGADEVHGDGVVAAGAYDVVPQLPAFLLGPRVGALVDGDDELGHLLEEVEQLGFGGFHRSLPNQDKKGMIVLKSIGPLKRS